MSRFIFENIPLEGQSPAGGVEGWSSALDSYPVMEMAKVARVEAAMEITCPGNSAPVKNKHVFAKLSKAKWEITATNSNS